MLKKHALLVTVELDGFGETLLDELFSAAEQVQEEVVAMRELSHGHPLQSVSGILKTCTLLIQLSRLLGDHAVLVLIQVVDHVLDLVR